MHYNLLFLRIILLLPVLKKFLINIILRSFYNIIVQERKRIAMHTAYREGQYI